MGIISPINERSIKTFGSQSFFLNLMLRCGKGDFSPNSGTEYSLKTADFFNTHPVFSLDEAVKGLAPQGGRTGTLERLNYHQKTGRLKRVSRGIYAVVPPGLSAKSFQFQAGETTKTLDIQNTGAGKLNWIISSFDPKPWLTINPVSGENNATVTFTVDWLFVTTENFTADLVINSTGGSENITISAFSFPSSIFIDDFSGDLSNWTVDNAVAEIENGFLELTGNSSTHWGTAKHELSSVQPNPWLFRAKFGRKNDKTGGQSAMFMGTNDAGTIIVSAYRFILNPPGPSLPARK